jgi:hypothetical protein
MTTADYIFYGKECRTLSGQYITEQVSVAVKFLVFVTEIPVRILARLSTNVIYVFVVIHILFERMNWTPYRAVYLSVLLTFPGYA